MRDIKIGLVMMAAGEGRRYGSNKLLADINGRRMFEYALLAVRDLSYKKVIVTGYDEIKKYADEIGFLTIKNDRPEEGISRTIRMGLEVVRDCDAVIFSVCDQPGVTESVYRRLVEGYVSGGKGLASMAGEDGTLGNPCIFGKVYYDELDGLTGDTGGKKVIKRHMDDLTLVCADAKELEDVDYRS